MRKLDFLGRYETPAEEFVVDRAMLEPGAKVRPAQQMARRAI